MEICQRSLPVACFVSNCGNNESHESFPDTKIMNFTELWSLAIKNCLVTGLVTGGVSNSLNKN